MSWISDSDECHILLANSTSLENEKEEKIDLDKVVKSVAENTGVSENMTRIILEEFYRFNAGQSRTGAEVVRNFIRYLLTHDKPIEEYLNYAKIKNSGQIGEVIMLFCEAGLIRKEVDDSVEEFEALFETENIQEYMKSVGLHDYKKRYKNLGLILLAIALLIFLIQDPIITEYHLQWLGAALLLAGLWCHKSPLKARNLLKGNFKELRGRHKT